MESQEGTSDRGKSLMVLARHALKLTEDLTAYLHANNLPEPSFALDSKDPPDTLEYRNLHAGLRDTLEDLQRLIDGPRKWIRAFCATGYDLGALQVALDFEFFTRVPSHGSITLNDLARDAGLDVDRTSRIIRQLMTYRFFQEDRPRRISHSSTSLLVREDDELRAFMHYSLDEMLKAAADCNTTLKAHPHETHQNLNPFVTRHGVGIFEFYRNNPEKAVRFSKAMAGLRSMDRHLDYLLIDGGFDWSSLNGTVIDCGGGSGHISRTLAQLHPNLNFIVQDSNVDMLEEGRRNLTDELRDRVSLMQHDFFDPQPVSNAAAFLIRQCIHNWSDGDVITILRGFVPGLESSSPETPLLINDIIIPEPGTWPRHQERAVRQVDMIMLVNCGSKQRTKAEVESLLRAADARFQIRNVFANGPLGLLEVYLRH